MGEGKGVEVLYTVASHGSSWRSPSNLSKPSRPAYLGATPGGRSRQRRRRPQSASPRLGSGDKQLKQSTPGWVDRLHTRAWQRAPPAASPPELVPPRRLGWDALHHASTRRIPAVEQMNRQRMKRLARPKPHGGALPPETPSPPLWVPPPPRITYAKKERLRHLAVPIKHEAPLLSFFDEREARHKRGARKPNLARLEMLARPAPRGRDCL